MDADAQNIPQQLIDLSKSTRPREVATGYLTHFRQDLEQALNYSLISGPRQGPMSLDAFTASVNLEVSTNARLFEAVQANPASFMKSLMLAAQCKLLVGGAHDLFYLIPRWNGRERRLEVSPLIGYKGLTELAQRHPRVHKVDAVLVFEGETFSYDAGAGKLTHIVSLDTERDEDHIIGGYARVVITEPSSTHPVLDDPVIHVMSRKQLMAIKHRSEAWQNAEKKGTSSSPWHTDPLPMHRKTLLRAVMNGGSVPRDMGIGAAIQADDQASAEPVQDLKPAPKVSRLESMRIDLGIDQEESDAPQFDLVEEAVAAMESCQTIGELAALKPRWQHFTGEDANTIANAYEDNEMRING